MPKDKIKRGVHRYKPYGKRKRSVRGNYQQTAVVSPYMPRSIGGFKEFGVPNSINVRLRYSDVITLTSTAGSLSKHVFRSNSLFDPDLTGVGHQPMYYDQLGALYSNYVVLGSKIRVLFSPIADAIATAQPSGPFEIGILSDPNGTTSSTATTLSETSGCKSTFLNLAQGGNNVKMLTATYSPTKDLALSADDDTTGATTSANPSQTWFWTVWMRDTGLSAASSLNIKVEIEFLARFRRREDIAGS